MATPPPEGITAVLKADKPEQPPTVNDFPVDSPPNRSPDSLPNGESHADDTTAAINEAPLAQKESLTPALNGHATSQPPLTNGASSPQIKTSTTPTEPVDQAKSEESSQTPLPAVKSEEGSKQLQSEQNNTDQPVPMEESKDIPLRDAIEPQQANDTAPAITENLKESSVPTEQLSEAKLSPTDVDMEDAPPSPTKVSRERELDLEEEPAAKRTKMNGDVPMVDSAESFDAAPAPIPASIEDVPPPSSNGITPLQQKFLVKCLTNMKRSNDSRFYREPVDPLKLNIPNYFNVITEPMDLSTIESKLKKNKYTAVAEIVADVELMTGNAVKFNGPDHIVSMEGQKLKASFQKQLEKLPKPGEVEEKKPKKAAVLPKEPAPRRESRVITQPAPKQQNSASSPTFALNPEGLPTIRRDSTNPDGRPKRAIHAPKRDMIYSAKPKKKKFQWELKFCQEILDELHKPKYWAVASPFYFPVDPVALNIPTYHSVIKKPMDLATIQAKLKAGQYENAKEMETDVTQIFKNCFKFNIPGDPTYIAGQKCEEIFKSTWAKKARWLEQHDPDNHQSSSEEDSEEEESDDDGSQQKLEALQRQIAEMSKQVEAITNQKKKTPPVSKKSGKSKSGKKKDSKKSLKGDRKSSKGGKIEKRNVSYHEKQLISNGISTLSDKKMQEALRIIQNNVPALKGTQETEIELDIDELPNEVLIMLLKFVKKNAPQVMDDDDVSAPVSAVQAKPKKNKPMSKFEQEAQINMLEGSLSRFQGGGNGDMRSPEPVQSVEYGDSSDGSDDDSEESEEE